MLQALTTQCGAVWCSLQWYARWCCAIGLYLVRGMCLSKLYTYVCLSGFYNCILTYGYVFICVYVWLQNATVFHPFLIVIGCLDSAATWDIYRGTFRLLKMQCHQLFTYFFIGIKQHALYGYFTHLMCRLFFLLVFCYTKTTCISAPFLLCGIEDVTPAG